VDATGLLVRCSRAAARSGIHASNGTPTGTLMMFIASLSRKIRAVQPDYLLAAWDGPDSLYWRRRLYPAYKANRAAPPVMGAEMSQALEFCKAAGIRSVMAPFFEADDILAAVQRLFYRKMPAGRLLLCSDDRDMLQLAAERTDITGLTADDVLLAADVEEAWGIEPARLSWVRALCGDKSDNIPGLRGLGRKKAVQVIREGGCVWPLPESVLPPGPTGHGDRRELVECWQRIIDLTVPLRSMEGSAGMDYFEILNQSRWRPAETGGVLEVLRKYELSVLASRMQKGRFW
jgi:DNA polymerase-1